MHAAGRHAFHRDRVRIGEIFVAILSFSPCTFLLVSRYVTVSTLTSLTQMRVRKRTCVSFIRGDTDFREVKYFPENDLV